MFAPSATQRALRSQAGAFQALELSFNSLLDGLAAAGVVLAFHPGIKSAQNKRADSDGYFGFGYGMTIYHTG